MTSAENKPGQNQGGATVKLPKGVLIVGKFLYHAAIAGAAFAVVFAAAVGLHRLSIASETNNWLSPEALIATRGIEDFIYACDILGVAVLVVWELFDLVKSIVK